MSSPLDSLVNLPGVTVEGVQAQVFYGKTAQTIREHLSGICNYFISGTTSGVMEGINNKIKLIMRLGYGLTNFNNLRSRLLGCCC